VLATAGELGEIGESTEIVFEEKAGPVRISIRKSGQGVISCELKAPQVFSLGKELPAEMVSEAICLYASEIVTDIHPPIVASVGLPFVMVELRDRSVLQKAGINPLGFQRIAEAGVMPDIHLYVRSGDEFDIRTRMFAPDDGVPEDPATGRANCALAGLLCHFCESASGKFEWRIAQGVEMGRPSLLQARAEKRDNKVLSTWIGGGCVLVSQGHIYID
jgi:trans-2,3-dihydro-3-hydroxyanthranilate isomerase